MSVTFRHYPGGSLSNILGNYAFKTSYIWKNGKVNIVEGRGNGD